MWSYDHDTHTYGCSLRSDCDAVDVSAVAKAMGGGGHPRAAGFSFAGRSIDDLLQPAPATALKAGAEASAAAGSKRKADVVAAAETKLGT